MKKVVDFLEQHVQWVALGAGFLYLLYMVYGYFVVPPVTASVGSATVNLGEVDAEIDRGPVQGLQRAMDNPEKVTFNMQSFATVFADAMNTGREKYQTLVLSGSWINSPTKGIEIPDLRLPGPDGVRPQGATTNPTGVAALPTLPAPTLVDTSTGRSTVLIPPEAQVQPQLAVAPPGGDAGAAQPQQPQVQPVAQEQDKDWVSCQFKIPTSAISLAFKAVKIPPQVSLTTFLRVELQREEQLPDGTWGNTKLIPPLALSQVPPLPTGANAQLMQNQYREWAAQNARVILQPPFYQIVKGSLWRLPSEPEIQQITNVQFDPANPHPPPYTEEEKKLIREYQAAEQRRKADERKNRGSTPRTAPPTGVRGGAGREMFAPRDPDRPILLAQLDGVPSGRRFREDSPEDGIGMYPGARGGITPGAAGASEQMQKIASTVPQQPLFDPAKLPDVDVVAHDDTAEPGKVYRYRMRYLISNPVYGMANLAKNPTIAAEFLIASPYSEWTKAVSIPPLVNFFLAAGLPKGAEEAKFKVYKWQDGKVTSTIIRVVPGDVVGKPVNEVDYSTGWTLIDVRTDSMHAEPFAILADPNGNLVKREFRTDESDPINQKLKREADNAANNPVAAGAP